MALRSPRSARTKLIGDSRPSASVRRFPIEGGLLLFDRGSNRLFAYNDTARYVWDLIDAGRTAGWASEFAQAWGIPLSRARADIASIVAQWRIQGLLAGSEHRPARVKPVSDLAAAGRRAAPTRWASQWTCTIGRTTISFAVEKGVPAPIRLMLRHLETPRVRRPQARIEIRSAPAGETVLLCNGSERLRTEDPAQLAGGLWQNILECLHPNVRWRALIHGAALARGGSGVAIMGPTGSGKTTLAAGLLGRGFDYLSDDLVPLSEPDGVIVPWPLPLSIKPGSAAVLKSQYPQLARARRYRTKGVQARLLVPSADVWGAKPVRLRVLVFPRFTAGAAPEKLRLSSFEALERLLTDRVWLGHPITEEQVASFLAWLDETPAYAVSYGTLSDGVHLVERVMT